MSGWLLPIAAAAFWIGILSETTVASRVGAPSWFLMVLGLALLVTTALLAPSRARGGDLLRHANLAEPGPPEVTALEPAPATPARAPPLLLALAMALAFVVLGAGWSELRTERLHNSFLAMLNGRSADLMGELRTDPEAGGFGWSALGSVSRLVNPVGARVHELVWLEGSDRAPQLRRGDRFEARGFLQRPAGGSFSEFLDREGVAVVLRVQDFRYVGHSTNPLIRAAQLVRQTLLGRVRALFPERQAGLLMGLALGDTSRLDPSDEEHFRATGLGHLLAVSGENVAMVLAPMLGLAILLRMSGVGRFALGVGTVLFFVVLTGGEPSVLRAGVMAVLMLVGVLLGRARSTGSVLGGSVLILLGADPSLVRDIGFQLSVAATAGMVALASPIADRLHGLPRPLALAAATTLSAQAGVSPLLLYHFHEVPEVTLLANVLAFPAVAPGMLLGLAAAAVSIVFQPAGLLLARLAEIPLRYLQGLADALASAPFPTITSPGGWPVLAVGFAVVGTTAWWLRSGRKLPRRAVVLTVAVLPLFVWSTALRAGPPGGLVVRFFDVGQGDAALVSSPGGANVLIDGGPDPELVATKLAALGVKRLDAVVATHPHLDHYIGLPTVLARFPVGLVVDSGCHPAESRSATYQQFLDAVEEEGIEEQHPTRGDVLLVGDLRFDVLSPDRCWEGTNSDPNNDSLVLLLTYREDTVLFANEPEADAQQVMLDDHEPLEAEVLNVPHHGAATSIAPFFEAVHETVAVVSVGPNTYGHPVPETLQELRDTGARVFRTDRSGDVVIRFAPPGLRVDTGRGRHFAYAGEA